MRIPVLNQTRAVLGLKRKVTRFINNELFARYIQANSTMNVQLITYEIDDSSSAVYTQPVGLSGLVKTSNDFGATFVPLRSYHSLNCQSYQQSVSVQDNFVYKFSFCTD